MRAAFALLSGLLLLLLCLLLLCGLLRRGHSLGMLTQQQRFLLLHLEAVAGTLRTHLLVVIDRHVSLLLLELLLELAMSFLHSLAV